jgi:polygalacturonase
MTNVFNVVDYGAVGDGKTKNTKAIAEAIEACSAAKGGRVLFPGGVFLTGPIILKSNVELHLETGSTILFTRDLKDYPLVRTHYEGRNAVRCLSPISGRDLHDIAITGGGVVDGSGEAWRPVKQGKMTPQQWKDLVAGGGVVEPDGKVWWPNEQAMNGQALVEKLLASGKKLELADYEPAHDYLRPCMVEFTECRNVRLEGPTFQNSPNWNIHPLMCDNVTIRNVRVINPWWSQNGDGLDLDSCRNCQVLDSYFDVGDDAICIKCGKDEAGRKLNRPTENITINNCTVVHGHGGVVIGSEMSGNVRNIDVSNCIFRGTDVGLRFKTMRGRGGVVENISIRNIIMENIKKDGVLFSMWYHDTPAEPFSERTPRFRYFHISNVICRGAKNAITLRGLPEMPIEAITIENSEFFTDNGVSIIDGKDISLIGVKVEAKTGPALQSQNVQNLTLERFDGTTTGK